MNKEEFNELKEMLDKEPVELLWDKIISLQEENQRYKEVIYKAIKFIKKTQRDSELRSYVYAINFPETIELLDILKEVE